MPFSQSTLELQKKLQAAGFSPGALDGIMGPKTQAALNAYNASQGKVTPIRATTITPTTVKPATPTTTTSGFSQATLDLQKKMKAAGIDPGPLDGINGPKTQAAKVKYDAMQAPKTPAAPVTPTTPAGYDPARINALVKEHDAKRTAGTTGTTTGTGTGTTGTADIQKFKDQYAAAEKAGDKQGMINAATAADKIRQQQGLPAQNTVLIARLTSELTPENSLPGATSDLLSKVGGLSNFDETYQPKQTEDQFMSEISKKINALLEEQKITAATNEEKARKGILTDADISKQEMDDAYAQQLTELSSQADKIRSAYASGKRNIETGNVNTMEDLATQADKIVQMFEQNRTQLGTDKQGLIDELVSAANKIRNAYSSAKRGIESERAETLPTYDTAINQQDVLAQRQAKQLEGEFAQRGLGAGGQVTSELSQLGQENLSQIGEISRGKQAYQRDVSNRLTGLEETQATGLADIERKKAGVEQDYTNKLNEIEANKTLSTADIERLKAQAARDYQNQLANLETEQTGTLSDLARAEATAAQTFSSGKVSIIKRVNAALSNLNTDEQALLDTLASQRTQMLFEAGRDYKNLSQKEKDAEFDRQLRAAGVAQDAVQTIRGLIDDINKAKIATLEADIKQLELQAIPEKLKLELKQMKQDIETGSVSIEDAKARLKIAQDQNEMEKEKLAFDKEQQLSQVEREQYNNYIDIVDSSSFVYKDEDGKVNVTDSAGLRNYIIGLSLDDDVTDSLLLRYGLSIN